VIKRYAVFSFDTYYPEGGCGDYVTQTDDIPTEDDARAMAAVACGYRDHVVIFDRLTEDEVDARREVK